MVHNKRLAYNNIVISAAHKQSTLRIGDPAPDFTASDTYGNPVRLSDYKTRHLLVVFLRYSACPWCNLTVHRLSMEYPLLRENGCEVVAFMQSTPSNIQKNIYGMHDVRPEYPIIPDVDQTYYKLFGTRVSLLAAAKSIKDIPFWLKSAYRHGLKRPEIDGNLLLVPAIFLISPGEQKLIYADYGSSFYDDRTFTPIYEPLNFNKRP